MNNNNIPSQDVPAEESQALYELQKYAKDTGLTPVNEPEIVRPEDWSVYFNPNIFK